MAVKTSTDLIKHFVHEGGTPADIDDLLRKRWARFLIPGELAVLGTAIASEVADATDSAGGAVAGTRVHHLMTSEKAITINSIKITPQASLTADDTNYAGLSFGYGDLAAGALTVIKLVNTSITSISSAAFTGNWTAATRFNVITTDTVVAIDKRISLTTTKPGTGVLLPEFMVEIAYTID